MAENTVSVHYILGQIFFYKLIYGIAYPEILAPQDRKKCHFELYFDP